MSSSTPATLPETEKNLPLLFQYSVEAYKSFQKLAEILPNPITARTFANFATDERSVRDLLDMKYRDSKTPRMQLTLSGDLRFQDMLEGDLGNRQIVEMLISRERTMERKLTEWAATAPDNDRNLFHYIAAIKRAHIALLEREYAFTQLHADWLRREDAISLVIHGQAIE